MERLNSQKSEYLDYVNSAKIQFFDKKVIMLQKQRSQSKIKELAISESCFIPKFFDSNPNKFVELPRILPCNIKLSRFVQHHTIDNSYLRNKGSANSRSKQYPQKKKKISYTPKQVLLLNIGNKSTQLTKAPLISLSISQNTDKLGNIDQPYQKNQSKELQASGTLAKIIMYNHGIKQIVCKPCMNQNVSPSKCVKTIQRQVSAFSPKKRSLQVLTTSSRRIKFTAYVEQGNNSRLVKQLLRRRNWIKVITEKQKKHEANILWTCFMDYKFYSTSQCVSKFSETIYKDQVDKSEEQEEGSDNFSNMIKWQTNVLRNAKQKNLLKPFLYEDIALCEIQQPSHSFQMIDKTKRKSIKILTHETEFCIKRENQILQLPRTSKLQKLVKIELESFQIHNHFRQHHQLSDKKNLFQNIKIYCKKIKIPENTIIPRTYHIKKVTKQEHKTELKKKTSVEGATDDNSEETMDSQNIINIGSKNNIIVDELPSQIGHDNKLWLIKPGQDSNRGNNIKIVNNRQKIENSISQLSELGKTAIVQQYIEPLLYRNRKFDIRCYVLLVSVRGVLRAYWYREGYLRTCCKDFSLDPSNIYCHLTNDAIQKNHKDYGKFQQANKLSFLDLSNFLKTKQNIPSFSNVVDSMKSLAKHSIKAVEKKLKLQQKTFCFEILGYDFLIDKNGKVWLIQVNTNPCLEFSGSLVSRIVWHMLENTFQIVLDVFNGNNNENPTIQNKYQCIY